MSKTSAKKVTKQVPKTQQKNNEVFPTIVKISESYGPASVSEFIMFLFSEQAVLDFV